MKSIKYINNFKKLKNVTKKYVLFLIKNYTFFYYFFIKEIGAAFRKDSPISAIEASYGRLCFL
jgi:hypothetical protein